MNAPILAKPISTSYLPDQTTLPQGAAVQAANAVKLSQDDAKKTLHLAPEPATPAPAAKRRKVDIALPNEHSPDPHPIKIYTERTQDLQAIMILLNQAENSNYESLAGSTLDQAKKANQETQDLQEAQIAEIQKQLAAQQKADEAQVPSTLKWLTKVAEVVGAVIGVAAAVALSGVTGGAAAPLLGLAVIGLVSASLDMASTISQANGGPALDPTGPLEHGVADLLELMHVPSHTAEGLSKVLVGVALTVTYVALVNPSSFGDIFGGIAELAGADSTTQGIVAGAFTAAFSIAIGVVSIVMTAGASSASAAVKIEGAVVDTTDAAVDIENAATKGESAVADASKLSSKLPTIDSVISKMQNLVQGGLGNLSDRSVQLTKLMAQALNIGQQVVSSGGNITTGGMRINASTLQYKADTEKADNSKLDGQIQFLQLLNSNALTLTQTILNALNGSARLSTQIMQNASLAARQAMVPNGS
ncbi:type III secretion system translocon subunit SctE [Paraburkholderia bonniea]|uniref:type III secretion system translocon subunit SctE n=1 Tax=Paraburkholderia bonniea TaxID=2152891 RepID=UPI0012928429|nr:type III secretion system translocon subunit SctE [Paraburkholderia bonniea]WJF89290.1 type III secretion system translocon subunit SctE [Paraburkholderia bonniea]WJF92606.1 type III secretion system translocon subunit SctE [Paraburkholderia bonniea]